MKLEGYYQTAGKIYRFSEAELRGEKIILTLEDGWCKELVYQKYKRFKGIFHLYRSTFPDDTEGVLYYLELESQLKREYAQRKEGA